MEKNHPSKVDALYVLLLTAIPLLGFVGVGLFSLVGQGLIALLLFFVAIVWPAWVLLGTRYRIDSSYLYASCGPLRYKVALDEIKDVAPKRSLALGPALSFDKLKITYANDKVLWVSPTDKYTFVFDLGLGRENEFDELADPEQE
ncbi:PH domain-containing protein [Aliidiomarina celeris]|uniref:PH domain-containing protein n=1 Tax=Aliidiomarina celeris TaxID=2249428 RepID=UPI000DE80ED4|nr:PH domain-containing protein [Aliidiomarina celeris]